MEHRTRRALISLWALPLALALPTAPPAQAAESPLQLVATATPSERLPIRPTWGDELAHRFATYLTTKYPHEQFEAYTQAVDRIREAVQRGDRWTARRETGVLLKMLTDRAHGLESEAAQDLIGLAQGAMPEEEFGIVFPNGAACAPESVSCP